LFFRDDEEEDDEDKSFSMKPMGYQELKARIREKIALRGVRRSHSHESSAGDDLNADSRMSVSVPPQL
jgi:hypothetical protein